MQLDGTFKQYLDEEVFDPINHIKSCAVGIVLTYSTLRTLREDFD